MFPRHIIAVVDGCLPDADEMWTATSGGCVIFPRARVHIAAQVGNRPRSRRPRRNRSRRPCGRRGRFSRWPSLSGLNTLRPKSKSLRRLRLVDRSAHWSVYAQVKKVTIQAHGKYAKLGGRADLLVAMVKDRFREVGEAIGVELKSAEE